MQTKELVYVGPASDQWVVRLRSRGVVGRFDELEQAVAAGIDRARAHRPSQLLVKGRDGSVIMDRGYGEGRWPPQQNRYFFYELSEGSRPHEGTTPLERSTGESSTPEGTTS